MHIIKAIVGTMLFVGALVPSAAAQESTSDRPEKDSSSSVSARALVGAAGSDRARAAEAIAAHGGRVLEFYAPGNFFIVETPSDAAEWSARFKGDPRVRYAEVDQVVTASATTPNDTYWSNLWGLHKIGLPDAWDTQAGSSAVVVGVIDSGVAWAHPDLDGRIWSNTKEATGTAGIDDDGNGKVDDVRGWDCRNNDGNPNDDNDHGSHVAGTIGAEVHNGIGVAGVAKDVRIMPLKFLGSTGSGYTSDAIECLDYAIRNGAHLTNNSWGGGGYSQGMYDAIGRARAAGQLFVAAAGNSSNNNDSYPHYPSSYALDNVISVASTTSSDVLSSFSNYGAQSVDIAAPGSSILSTLRSGYGTMSGTSMAAPHVAGAAALLVAQNPNWSYAQIRDRLYSTVVDPSNTLGGKVATGGRLDLAAALGPPETATPTDPAVDAPPKVSISSPAAGATVRGSVTVRATASDDRGVAQVQFFDGGTAIGSADANGSDGWSASWTGSDGTHTLTAVATDGAGQATTSAPITVIVDNSYHIGDIDDTSYKSSSYWYGRAVFTVHHALEGVLAGAEVTGTWAKSSGTPTAFRCVTSSAGTCSFVTGRQSRSVLSLTVTVTRVAHSSGVYKAAANHDPDGSSDGTKIVLRRPW